MLHQCSAGAVVNVQQHYHSFLMAFCLFLQVFICCAGFLAIREFLGNIIYFWVSFSISGQHFCLCHSVLLFIWRGMPIWPGRVRHGSVFDWSPSAPQVHIVGFFALSLAQAMRGAPFWPGRVGHSSVFDWSPSAPQVH